MWRCARQATAGVSVSSGRVRVVHWRMGWVESLTLRAAAPFAVCASRRVAVWLRVTAYERGRRRTTRSSAVSVQGSPKRDAAPIDNRQRRVRERRDSDASTARPKTPQLARRLCAEQRVYGRHPHDSAGLHTTSKGGLARRVFRTVQPSMRHSSTRRRRWTAAEARGVDGTTVCGRADERAAGRGHVLLR